MTPLPHSIFHASPAQRAALARERFFEEGLRPTGLISEAVIQSWGRCLRRHRQANERVEFEPVSPSRAHHALQSNRELVEAWDWEVQPLRQALRSTTCASVLTDASGVVIAAMPSSRAHERLMPIAHRVGVNLSEEAVGTTAPGVVAKSGQALTVLGGEHFFDGVKTMYCAAAPIRDISGRVAGVFDISSEVDPFRFDAAALANLYATTLESRLLIAQSKHLLVVRLQARSALLDTPLAGLAGVDGKGDLVWVNGVAGGLLGVPRGRPACSARAEDVFGMQLPSLLSLPEDNQVLVELPNRLSIWLRCEQLPLEGTSRQFPATMPESTIPQPPPESSPEEASCDLEPCRPGAAMTEDNAGISEALPLRALDKDYIERTVRACGGNVSKAAKQLDVSRGLIYRRLRD